MNKITLLTTVGLFVIGSSLLAPQKVEAAAVMSGVLCEAANLNQAQQGIGWSQAGVKNNAATSFFVVCGLAWQTSTPTNNVLVLATFPNNSGGEVECTARTQDFGTGTYTGATFTILNSGSGRAFSGTALANIASNLNTTIVCALDPGEAIEGYLLN